jgi:hypothetical protein
MNESDKEIGYPALNDEISAFFDRTLPELIREADSRFQQPLRKWLRETHKELLHLRKEQTDDYVRSVTVLQNKLPDLRSVITEKESRLFAAEIRKMVVSALEQVPEWIEQSQSQERFDAIEGDSPYVRLLKFGKRTARRIAGKKRDYKQKIPFRDLLARELLEDTAWIRIWLSESYKDQSEILELFLEKPEQHKGQGKKSETEIAIGNEPETEPTPEQEAKKPKVKKGSGKPPAEEPFHLEVIEEFESHLEQVIKRIESTEILENNSLEDYFGLIRERVKRKAERAGTIEQSGTVQPFETTKVNVIDKATPGKVEELENAWITCLKSIRNDLQVQTEIAIYGIEAEEARENILEELHKFFRDYGYLPIENAITITREMGEKLKKTGKSSLSSKLTEELRERVETDLRETALSNLNDQDGMKQFISAIQKELSDLQIEQSMFTESIRLAKERELTLPVPRISFDELNWRSLASRHIQEKALRDINPENAELITFIQQIAENASENLQIVDVNLAAAYESKEHEEEERPLDIAMGGIDRAILQFEETIKLIRKKQDDYEQLIEKRLDDTLHELADMMLSRAYDTFERQDKALQVKETALRWTDRLEIIAGDTLDQSKVLWRFLMQKIRKARKTAGRFLGFTEEEGISSKEKRSLSEYLAKSDRTLELPFIYRRLFEPGFEIDNRFNITPDGFYTSIESAFSLWKEGMETNVLVLGERGSGKTNAVRFTEEKLMENETVIHVVFNHTFVDEKTLVKYFSEALGYSGLDSVEALIEKINRRRKKTVLVVENLQNAFIRNMHGFSAIEAFWVLMSSTKKSTFWMVTVSRYAWKFFDKMSSADQYFSHINEIDILTDEQIRKAITIRHKSTGFQMVFDPAASVKNSRAYKKLLNNDVKEQEYLADFYFDKLADIAEGNMSVATIFWLQSIKEFDEKKMVIAPIEVADVDRLEIPSRNVLFTLAAFALHDTINEEQLAMALHQDLNESRLMIGRLRSKGILLKTEEGYRMNQLVYRQVIRLLKRRNILH